MTSDTILVPEVAINPLPKFHFGIEFHPVPHVMIICHLVPNNNRVNVVKTGPVLTGW